MTTSNLPTAPLRAPGVGVGLVGVLAVNAFWAYSSEESRFAIEGPSSGGSGRMLNPCSVRCVLFVALGVFLQLNSAIEFYPVYLLTGMTAVTFFNEAFRTAPAASSTTVR